MQPIKTLGMALVTVLAMSALWAGSASAKTTHITLIEPVVGELTDGETVEALFTISYKDKTTHDECEVVAPLTLASNDAATDTLEQTINEYLSAGYDCYGSTTDPRLTFHFGANGKTTVNVGPIGIATNTDCEYDSSILKGHNGTDGPLNVSLGADHAKWYSGSEAGKKYCGDKATITITHFHVDSVFPGYELEVIPQ
jgi:hypothetical protein